jgi:hypothetical protein
MLADIKHRTDQLKEGDYSPEMRHAIIVKAMLEDIS